MQPQGMANADIMTPLQKPRPFDQHRTLLSKSELVRNKQNEPIQHQPRAQTQQIKSRRQQRFEDMMEREAKDAESTDSESEGLEPLERSASNFLLTGRVALQ